MKPVEAFCNYALRTRRKEMKIKKGEYLNYDKETDIKENIFYRN
jgi:hypothetical protein